MAYDLMTDEALRAEIEKLIENDVYVASEVFGHEIKNSNWTASRMSRSTLLKYLKGNDYILPLAKEVERIKKQRRLRDEEEKRKEKEFAEAEPLRQKCIADLESSNVKIHDLRESLDKVERLKRDIQDKMFKTPHDHKWSDGNCTLCNDRHPDYRSRMSF